jgi:DNA repair photolyase
VLLRRPHEVEPLFRDWLRLHYPERAAAVMNVLEACHRGRAYRSDFHVRMKGQGIFADMIAQRFRVARRRYGLERESRPLDTQAFTPASGPQMALF